MADEPNAVLTSSQREFLRGEGPDPDSSHGRTTRTRIRKRVRRSLLDFELLNERLRDDDRKRIAESFEFEELGDTIRESSLFLAQLGDSHSKIFDAEEAIEAGVADAKKDRIERLKDRYERGDRSLTWGEMEDLQAAGVITPAEQRERAENNPQSVFGSLDDVGEYLGMVDADEAKEALESAEDGVDE